jgi:hypothetical protein
MFIRFYLFPLPFSGAAGKRAVENNPSYYSFLSVSMSMRALLVWMVLRGG